MRISNIVVGLAFATALTAAGAASAAANGQQVYANNCAACHQPTGEGRPPVFPALKGDKTAVGPKAAVLAVVLNGRGAMPAWKTALTDEEVAAVVTYVRNAWGNKAPAVTTADVTAAKSGKPLATGPKKR